MGWKEYAIAMLLFSGVSMLLLYFLQRAQGVLPFNPQKLGKVAPDLAFNTPCLRELEWNAQTGLPPSHSRLVPQQR